MGKTTPLSRLILSLIFISALINLISVFGPELGFDALWYHLTLPKLFIETHRWYFPGGLLYYSAMPRLAETLFIPLLQFFGTSGPKFLQFFSGIVTTYFIYQIAREFFDRHRSLLGALIFYTTWLVSWQSGSAYVDLIRTMFETIALYFILKDQKIFAGIALGLAIGVKWHALGTMLIFGAFFSPVVIPVALITASPWFYLALRFTGSPIYPLFQPFMTATQLSQVDPHFFGIFNFLKRIISLPVSLAHPIDDLLNPIISPLFLIGIFGVMRHNRRLKSILLIAISGLIFWQLTPPPSARYLLPFLPSIIIVCLSAMDFAPLRKIIAFSIIASAIVLIFSRTYANSKYLRVVLGQVTINQFLTERSDKLPGTYIDSDGWLSAHIPPNSSLLVDRWHNLYYLPHTFTHTSWADPLQNYDYLLTRDTDPKTVNGKLMHTNTLGAQLYRL